jgi:hypothetical protein
MTLTTLHLLASNPAAMTRNTTSLLVKIPAIRGGPLSPIGPGEVAMAPSITQTAVVRLSFMSFATSRTFVLGPTVAGCVRESMMLVKSGNAVFSRSFSAQASIAAACGLDPTEPSSDWTPAIALKSCSEAAELRSTLPKASWKTLVISRRPTTLPSSLQTGYGQHTLQRGAYDATRSLPSV